MRSLLFAAVVWSTGCSLLLDSSFTSGEDAPKATTDAASDALAVDDGGDAAPARCTDQPFGAPVALDTLNTALGEGNPRLSEDELVIVFGRPPVQGAQSDIFIATRASKDAPFSPPNPLVAANSIASDLAPTISADGLVVIFASRRTGGTDDLYRVDRPTRDAPFGLPVVVPGINTLAHESDPFLLGTDLYFSSDRSGGGGKDLFMAANLGASTPLHLTSLASSFDESDATLASDGLTIFFSSRRTDTGAKGQTDIWFAKRASKDAPFSPPQNLAELNTSDEDVPGYVSADNCRLYIASDRPGGKGSTDLYVATRTK